MSNRLSNRAAALVARTQPHQTCLRALLVFAAQNPGFEWGNYASPDRARSLAAYHGDARPVARQLREIRDLSWRFPSLDDTRMREAARRSFSGRVTFVDRPGGWVAVDYCTGQYWPREYRKASLAVIREAIRLADEAWAAGPGSLAGKGGARTTAMQAIARATGQEVGK